MKVYDRRGYPRVRLTTLLGVLLVSGGEISLGGGPNTVDRSAYALGMGGVVMASVSDVSAIAHNPALLSAMDGTRFSAGAMVLVPVFHFTGIAPGQDMAKSRPGVFFPPIITITHRMKSSLGLGVSVNVPYMSEIEWEPDWVGRQIATRSEFRAVLFSPAVGFPVSDIVSLGLALNIVTGRIVNTRAPDPTEVSVTETLQGESRASVGFQAGFSLTLGERSRLGLSYRSAVRLDYGSGTSTTTGMETAAGDTELSVSFSNTVPSLLGIGLSLNPVAGVLLEADLEYTAWHTSDQITLDFRAPNGAFVPSQEVPLKWSDSWCARFGGQLQLGDMTLRAGLWYDRTPIPDEFLRPSLPDAAKIGYGAGIGYRISQGLGLDFALAGQSYLARTIADSQVRVSSSQTFNGKYTGSTTVVSLNVSYYWN